MTSLEIAELTGKNHFDLLRAIRKMEPAWEKTCGCKFALTSRTIIQPNGGTREVPCYMLTKTECLYIATKFNDEARARLVLRWQELELAEQERQTPAAPSGSTSPSAQAAIAGSYVSSAKQRRHLLWEGGGEEGGVAEDVENVL